VPTTPFLKEEELATGPVLGLFALRSTEIEGQRIYLIGGLRLDQNFLSTLALPSGMHVMLYENPGQSFSPARLIAANADVEDSAELRELIERATRQGSESQAVIHGKWGDETVTASALRGANDEILGALIIANSRRIYLQLRSQIRSAALLALAAGIALAMIASSWAAARVTKPVEDLAQAARAVAGGDWTTSVAVRSHDELGELAEAFNRMTARLLSQQDRLVQAERVAAWRDLARRLAHELKNPLFPLQLTVENLLRAREQSNQLFDETFRESTATLLSEIQRLKAIVARFNDFSKMPQPEPESLDLAELARSIGKLYEPQLSRTQIDLRLEAENIPPIMADPELLHRALSNLVLNAIEAMPDGGTLTIRIRRHGVVVEVEIADTGPGLTPEERARIFTPYYTTKPDGTGLGLAIVQSIVSDHRGRLSVASEPGRGTTFMIELPDGLSRTGSAEGMHG
jgi:nitrogen fixation/metabolism regulation signal transduction histidine kinase